MSNCYIGYMEFKYLNMNESWEHKTIILIEENAH